MKELFESGRLIDVALAAIVIEVVVFALVGRRRLPLVDVLGQLLAGAFLLLGLRCVITGADYRLTLLFLTASFPAHMFDLLRRSRRAPSGRVWDGSQREKS